MLYYFDLRIFKTFINTTSEFDELMVIVGSGSSSILQSGMPESKSVMEREVFVRLILMFFSRPNLFFNSFGESTAEFFLCL